MHIHCEMMITVKRINIYITSHITPHFFFGVMRTLEIYFSQQISSVQILLIIVTMMNISFRFPKLIYLITESL